VQLALSRLEATNKRQTNRNSATLWQRLADEMRAARQRAGVRPGAWADDPEVLWTRSRISNLEHGRGRPPEEFVELYDRRFPNPEGPRFLRRLRAQAERVSIQSDVPKASPRTSAAPAPPRTRRPPRAIIAAVTTAAALACAVVAVLMVLGHHDRRRAAVSPPLGRRTVCARDLRVRSAPQADLDEAEPQLTRRAAFVETDM
jgi:hypothetical protein